MAPSRQDRLAAAAKAAKVAEASGDIWAAQEGWDRYQLIRDASRPADERLAETIGLSRQIQAVADTSK